MQQPTLSIVIASELEEGYLRRCLESLLPSAGRHAAEVLVSHASEGGIDAGLKDEFPQVRFIPVAGAPSIPDLRYAGAAAAAGELIATTEAFAVFQEGWIEAVLEGHRQGFDVVGGPIQPHPSLGRVGWAAHLCEFGALNPPLHGGPGQDVSGFNACYRRQVFEACRESVEKRHWETILHQEAHSKGFRFMLLQGLLLFNGRNYGLTEFLRQRFRYGRGYGRVRAGRVSRTAHLALLLLSPGLPLLLLWRYCSWAFQKRLPKGRMLVALPLLALFAAAWSAGEWMGYAQALGQAARGKGAR
ncbi:MAG: glycosyltransferase [Acidobacteriota bacterium]